ncbi:MAG: hypothetical protein JRH11_14625 [Deltaproteobacteria bacterium]|nr:hypothetical protein [Deltaproteobacteria bacterium]
MHSHIFGGPGASHVSVASAFVGMVAVFILVILVNLATSTTAAAQCAEGRVANEQTQGRCCWSGQTWSPETSLCTGAPACPAGRVGQGDDCVVAAGAGQPVQAQGTAAVPVAPTGYGAQPQPQPQAQPQYQQPAPVAAPAGPVRTEERVRTGLLIPGVIMFGASYTIALLSGIGAEYGYLAIPFAGPFILAGDYADSSTGSGGGEALVYIGLSAWGLVQVAGVAMFILGLTLKKTVEVRADLGGGRSVALAPYEVPGGGGLQLLGEF